VLPFFPYCIDSFLYLILLFQASVSKISYMLLLNFVPLFSCILKNSILVPMPIHRNIIRVLLDTAILILFSKLCLPYRFLLFVYCDQYYVYIYTDSSPLCVFYSSHTLRLNHPNNNV
jgi:hypothetical protein